LRNHKQIELVQRWLQERFHNLHVKLIDDATQVGTTCGVVAIKSLILVQEASKKPTKPDIFKCKLRSAVDRSFYETAFDAVYPGDSTTNYDRAQLLTVARALSDDGRTQISRIESDSLSNDEKMQNFIHICTFDSMLIEVCRFLSMTKYLIVRLHTFVCLLV
jgi:hypothetical protein